MMRGITSSARRRGGVAWYIDNAVGTSGNGVSWATAWKSFTNIVWASVQPGDTIYLSGGTTSKTYSEVLWIAKGGTSGRLLTFSAGLDAGHNGTVIIDGGGTRTTGFYNNGYNYVILRKMDIKNHYDAQIDFRWCTAGCIIENCNAYSGNPTTGSNARGFDIRNNTGSEASPAVILRNCTFDTPANSALQTDGVWSSGNTGVLIENNKLIISNSNVTGHSDGIQSFEDTQVTIRNNFIYQNNSATTDNHGMWLSNTKAGTGLKVHGNVVYAPNLTADSCIAHWLTSDWTEAGKAEFLHNTIIGGARGLSLDKSVDTIVKDNIIIPASSTGVAINMVNGNLATSNVTNNLLYAASGNVAFVNSANQTWSQWQSLGFDASGVNANPTFTSISDLDFTLQAGTSGTGTASDATNIGTPLTGSRLDPQVEIPVTLFAAAFGDGATSVDSTAKTFSVTYGTANTGIRAPVPVVIGKRYRVTWTYSGATGMQLYAGSTTGGIQYRPNIANDLFIDLTATTTELSLTFQRVAAGTTTVSNLKIREIPQATWVDTALITPAGWVSLSAGVTVDQTTGAITIPATGTLLSARQGFATTVGKLYRVRWNLTASTFCLIGTSNGGSQMKSAAGSDTAGDKTYEFRPTTTTSWLQYQRSVSGTTVVSNIFVQVAV